MYLIDRVEIFCITVLWIIVVILGIYTKFIDLYFGIFLIAVLVFIAIIVRMLQVDKYRKDMHDNLEQMLFVAHKINCNLEQILQDKNDKE